MIYHRIGVKFHACERLLISTAFYDKMRLLGKYSLRGIKLSVDRLMEGIEPTRQCYVAQSLYYLTIYGIAVRLSHSFRGYFGANKPLGVSS